ncbi:hypothetical protein [Aestuariispira insulae]|uniref:Uncharacterized protein n=1 Tax=Aestuariispira insulae TaxID=1461337 RepID=A0A3D9H5T8_9PROT|nr:hypothetical protein [Aestuariispira insulae]RED44812.1 hypothetical protein DFP90_11317 [Aestuariispira insulae]
MLSLIITKTVISIFTILGLSWLTERVSPRMAGLLSGYPIGTAIALYFIGYEQGAAFAVDGAVYTLAGLSATLAFVVGYYYASRRWAGWPGVFLSALCGNIAFFTACLLLRHLPDQPLIAILSPILAILFFSWLFRHIPDKRIDNPVRLGWRVLAFRAFMAAGTVITITGVAASVGPEWSGLFAAFPITVFPLFLIIHAQYGSDPIAAFVRNFPRGLGALVVYCLTIHYSYGSVGITFGTLLSFLTATIYLMIYGTFTRQRARHNRQRPSSGR